MDIIQQEKNKFNFSAEKNKTLKTPPPYFKPEKTPTPTNDYGNLAEDIYFTNQYISGKLAEQKDIKFLIDKLKNLTGQSNLTDKFNNFLTENYSKISSLYHYYSAETFPSFDFITGDYKRDEKIKLSYTSYYDWEVKKKFRTYFPSDDFDDDEPHYLAIVKAKHEKQAEPDAFMHEEKVITGTVIIKDFSMPTAPINNKDDIKKLNFYDKITDNEALKRRTEKAVETRKENRISEQEEQRKAEQKSQLNPEHFKHREELTIKIKDYFLPSVSSDRIEVIDKKVADNNQPELANSNYLFKFKSNLTEADKELQQEITNLENEINTIKNYIKEYRIDSIKFKKAKDEVRAFECEEKISILDDELKPLQENLTEKNNTFFFRINSFARNHYAHLNPKYLTYETIFDEQDNKFITYIKPNNSDEALKEFEDNKIIDTSKIKFSKSPTPKENKLDNFLRGIKRTKEKLLTLGVEYCFNRFLTLSIDKQIDFSDKLAQQIKLDFIHKTLQPGDPFYFSKYFIFADNTESDALHFHILFNSEDSNGVTEQQILDEWNKFLMYYEVTRDNKIIKRKTTEEIKDGHLTCSEKAIKILWAENEKDKNGEAATPEQFLNKRIDYVFNKIEAQPDDPKIANKSRYSFVGFDKRYKYYSDKYLLTGANIRIAILEAFRSILNGDHLTYNIFDKIQKQQYSEFLENCNFELLNHTITDIEFFSPKKITTTSKSDGIVKIHFKSTFKITELKAAINASQSPPFT